MIRSLVTYMKRLLGAVANYSIGLFYSQWTHRYMLYLAGCVLVGIWTFVALEIYGWITWRVTSISFRGNHILHTMINFGLCLYIADEWLARLTGQWGRFNKRTLGKQALIWGMSFVAAFYVQRTIVFDGIQYYALDIFYYYEQYPQMRPRPFDHFLFCLPFFSCMILSLWLIASVREFGLQKERSALASKERALVEKEEALQNKLSNHEIGRETTPLSVQSGSSQIILDQDSISHVTVEDHYCRIHTWSADESKSYFIKSSLTELLKKLPDSHFIQIHRSHVVNARAIRQIDKKNRACKVYLKSNVVLPVSRHRLNEVKVQIQDALDLQDIRG